MKKFNTDKANIPPFLRLVMSGVIFAMAPPAAAKSEKQNDRPAPPPEQDTIEDLHAKMTAAFEAGNTIRATADAEQRMLSEDESKELDRLSDEFDNIESELKERERLVAQRERLAANSERISMPQARQTRDGNDEPRQRVTGGDHVGATKGSYGWRSFGEFSKGVIDACRNIKVDQRLIAAATTYGSEITGPDGGYAVPPDFREGIQKKIDGEESLLSRTDQQYTSSNKMTVPQDTTTPWQTSGGVQVYWESEASTMTQSKLAAEQLEVKANRANCLVPITEELLEDVPSLSRYLPGKVADKFVSKFNDSILNGDGVGKPQGLLNAGSKVKVLKEAGQAAATIKFENLVKMWSRMLARLRPNAIWLINQDIEPQLQQMVVPGATPAYPAYLPPGGLSQAPYGTLFGRPLIPVEACATLGTEGDIVLANLSSYLTVQKIGGMRQDVSMHVYFEQAMQAFRFMMRLGGQSWWKTTVARQNGSNTLGNIVSLETR